MTTDPTAQSTPTPAPVAVPEGVDPTVYAEVDYEVWERHRNTLAFDHPGDGGRYFVRHADLAPRPEPVTASEHHVPGAENFNALLDDVLANPEAREAFEAAQVEPVTAPLPSEGDRLLDVAGDVLTALDSDLRTRSAELDAVTAVLRRHFDGQVPEDDEDTVRVPGFLIRVAAPTALASDDPIVRTAARKLLAACPAADQRARDEGTVREADLARMIDADATRADGTPSLLLALSSVTQRCIEDVYADCGDHSPSVLSSNIATYLEPLLVDALSIVKNGEVQ